MGGFLFRLSMFVNGIGESLRMLLAVAHAKLSDVFPKQMFNITSSILQMS
jgi:hypothetical protein